MQEDQVQVDPSSDGDYYTCVFKMPAADVIILTEFEIDPTYQVLKYGKGDVSVNVTETGTINVTSTPVGSYYCYMIKALDKNGTYIGGIVNTGEDSKPKELSFTATGSFILLVEFYGLPE